MSSKRATTCWNQSCRRRSQIVAVARSWITERRSSQTVTSGPNRTRFLLIKMYWNIAMPIHVCIVYGYFHSTAQGLKSMTNAICPSLCTANTQMKEIPEFSPRPFVLWACQAVSLFPVPKRVKKESRALRLFVQAKEYRSGMRVRGLQSIHLILALLNSTGGHCVIT